MQILVIFVGLAEKLICGWGESSRIALVDAGSYKAEGSQRHLVMYAGNYLQLNLRCQYATWLFRVEIKQPIPTCHSCNMIDVHLVSSWIRNIVFIL